MLLVSQLAGAISAGILVLVLARQAGARGKEFIGVVALVPVAVAGLLALPNVTDSAEYLLNQRQEDVALSGEEAQLQGGVLAEVDVAFIGWAGDHFTAGDTFWLTVCKGTNNAAAFQWGSFQLAPHLAVENPSEANWLIFYDCGPARYRDARHRGLEFYAPGFAVARGIDAH